MRPVRRRGPSASGPGRGAPRRTRRRRGPARGRRRAPSPRPARPAPGWGGSRGSTRGRPRSARRSATLPPRRPTTSQASRAGCVGGVVRPVKRWKISTSAGVIARPKRALRTTSQALQLCEGLEPRAEEMRVVDGVEDRDGRARAGLRGRHQVTPLIVLPRAHTPSRTAGALGLRRSPGAPRSTRSSAGPPPSPGRASRSGRGSGAQRVEHLSLQ